MSKIVGGNPKKAEKKNFIAVHSTIEKRKLQVSNLSSYLSSQGKEETQRRQKEEVTRSRTRWSRKQQIRAAKESAFFDEVKSAKISRKNKERKPQINIRNENICRPWRRTKECGGGSIISYSLCTQMRSLKRWSSPFPQSCSLPDTRKKFQPMA